MTAVVFYFQVHQPYRLRPFRYLEIGEGRSYFDDELNKMIVERVAERCYLPMNAILREAIEKTEGRFRCSFSLTGTLLSQLEAWAPEALDSFVELAATGSAEVVCETSCHSLSSLDDPEEFADQVDEQRERVRSIFGQDPKTFRNTEMIIDADVARRVEDMGFDALLGEGADRLLEWRSPRRVYRPAGCRRLALLLRDYSFSDDIAFRFSNREWPEYPLMADRYASWIHRAGPEDVFIGLFMDYETFGEHQNKDTGILEFMKHLPGYVLADPRFSFRTPSEIARDNEPVAELALDSPISWADKERDLSAWLGNEMQRSAHRALHELGPKVRQAARRGHPELLDTWRKLTTSDHVYYMSTKWHSDGDVHEYFTPYDSPHDSYIIFMNVLDDLAGRVERVLDRKKAKRK